MKFKCIEQAGYTRLLQEALFSLGQGKPLVLSADSQQHLVVCAFCKSELPSLIKQSQGMREMVLVHEVVDLARDGDPSVRTKRVKGGIGLFRPPRADEQLGVFAMVDDSYRLLRMGRITGEVFEEWSV